MTANEPPNPYTPTSAALADGAPASAKARRGGRAPSRALAAIVALIASPLSGAGLYLLGRPRRAVFWIVTTVLLWSTMIVAARVSQPQLVVIAIALTVVSMLAGIVDTMLAKPGQVGALGRSVLVVLALFVGGRAGAFAVRHWLVEAFQIPSGAMMPTLLIGDHIFVKKGRGDVARGDLVVFEFPRDRSTDYIKRVVALGGDRLQVAGGVVSVNGVALAQTPIDGECPVAPHMPGSPADDDGPCRLVRETNGRHTYTLMRSADRSAPDFGPITVPDGEVFVFGDNRDNSYDSRVWGGVPADHIKGVASMTWWSKVPNGPVRWSRVGHGVE